MFHPHILENSKTGFIYSLKIHDDFFKRQDTEMHLRPPPYIYIYIYKYIYSPTPVGLNSLANEVIVLPLAFMQGSSYMNWDLGSR